MKNSFGRDGYSRKIQISFIQGVLIDLENSSAEKTKQEQFGKDIVKNSGKDYKFIKRDQRHTKLHQSHSMP